jgi:hypothetical protein
VAAPLVLTGGLAGLAPGVASAAPATSAAPAASCQNWTGLQPPNPGTADNELEGVAVASACNAWAVGLEFSAGSSPEPLIEHWNGSSWKVSPSPVLPGRGAKLLGVSAVSASNIWAVGGVTDLNGIEKTLIEHWNGKKWTQVGGSNPGSAFNELESVRARSAKDIWAVGFKVNSGGPQQALIEHYDGHKWTQKTSPHPGRTSKLLGVTATSSGNAWAVGQSFNGTSTQTLIERWNGKKWTPSSSPHPNSGSSLSAVDATSASSAWAVGTSMAAHQKTLILHWNGKKWSQQTSPNPQNDNELAGVTAISSGNVWAAGTATDLNGNHTLLLNWNGRRWSRVPSPNLGQNTDQLNAVDASSGSNLWAVGSFNPGTFTQALVIHCC